MMGKPNSLLLYFRLLSESLGFAAQALRTNKLRTLLSLLGVTVGIFSIIAVLAAVDSLNQKITKDLSSLDKNSIYLMRFSFGPTEVPRWKREQFPDVSYDEYENLRKNLRHYDKMAFCLFTKNEPVKYENKTVSSVRVTPTTDEFETIDGVKIGHGRFFNNSESNSGTQVVVLGYEVAMGLFDTAEEALGKKIRLYGQRFTVIGVIEKQGFSTFDESRDDALYIPMNFIRRLYGDNNEKITPAILIKPEKEVDMEAFKAELIQRMRTLRGIKEGEINTFFLNVLSGFTDFLDDIFSNLNFGGWVISFFSLLVGGFGIANIMFVSVKERTHLIGIQKSLGAKNRFILFQFLFEAVILCLIGGMVGLLLVWLVAQIMTSVLDFEFVLSLSNCLLGTGLSVIIGLVSGIIPAISASRLDPVEAIRSGQ
jgi:putative ABC transport system permease protein